VTHRSDKNAGGFRTVEMTPEPTRLPPVPRTSNGVNGDGNVSAMAKLVYSAITSLDGYIADENGDITWGAPSPEVFAFILELERNVGTYLYGRRMYETMVYWETFEPSENDSPEESAFADVWKSADKIVYSTTLAGTSSSRTRIERSFDAETIREMKRNAEGDFTINGPNLANQAMAAGLIDEVHLLLTPVTLGGGTSGIPRPFLAEPVLVAVDRFADGVVHLQYSST
jgi:dihydrofolate reductase